MDVAVGIAALSDATEARWAAADHRWEAFPEAAAAALGELGLHEAWSVDDLMGHIVGSAGLPRQVDPQSAFGEPPVTLSFGDRFAIDVYFWHRPVVSVHNHSFAGAFMVLAGRSLHTRYTFEIEASYDDRVMTGAVRALDVELLEPGSVRRITSNLDDLHQVAHLSRPCATLVVRTNREDFDHPIYTYMPPSAALLAPRWLTTSQRKQLAMIELLYKLDHRSADARAAELVEGAEDLLAAWTLRAVAQLTQDVGRARGVCASVRQRAWFEAYLESMACTDAVDLHWDHVLDEGYRLFGMLVKYVADRDTRDRIAGQYLPGHSFVDAVVAWTKQLAMTGGFGVALPELAFVALRCFTEGMDDAQTADALVAHFGTERPPDMLANVNQVRGFFTSRALYRALFESC